MDSTEIGPNEYFKLRCRTLENRTKYPHSFNKIININSFVEKYDLLENNHTSANEEAVAGRLGSMRNYGKKLVFIDVHEYDTHGKRHKLQIVANKSQYSAEADTAFNEIKKMFGIGDWIGIIGSPYRSKTGELSVMARSIKLLAPCLHMIPFGSHSSKKIIEDPNTLYRQKYLDLLINNNSMETFITRSTIINHIRHFLNTRNFVVQFSA